MEHGGNLSSCLFQPPRWPTFLGLCFPSPFRRASNRGQVLISHHSDILYVSLFHFKGPSAYYVGPAWISQDNFHISRSLITSTKSLLPCKANYSQVLEIRMWTFLQAIILSTICPFSSNDSLLAPSSVTTCHTVVMVPDTNFCIYG